MAFGFASSPAGANIPAELGPELPDVYAEEVGFKGVSGDTNIRLLPTPWPEDALPSPTSSLLAVAPTKGVIVGAGPDSLVIASSDAVRKTIAAPTGEDKVKTKPFQPQATISLPARPTHVAFVSGESALVVATENGAQLAVYETASLTTGNAQPALSIPTNNATFRALAPNPAQADDAHSSLVALVTNNGELLIADLKAGNLLSGPNGQVLKTGVSSVCWSNKGKQLVAGLADGTGYQMAPDGAQKDIIPRPSDLEGDCHVSSIAWLENDIFLMVYTPNAAEDDMGQVPSSSYYIITRKKQAPFEIRKLPELCTPFGFKRAPAYQFIARLRDYRPHLKDVLIVSSTASTDVGMITRSDQPLASDDAAKETVGLFTTTEVNDDTKRASLPLKDSVDETTVIGLGIDLSSTDVVISPIQGEDIAESSTPLPNVLLLNNEGILSSWWFIYSDSIRQKIPYHGLSSVGAPQQAPAATPAPAPAEPPKQPAFGQSAFGSPSALGASSAFAKPSSGPAFGSPSPLGVRQQPAFGAPSFGTPSQLPSFGTPSTLNRGSPQFGQSGFGSMGAKPAFGQPSTTAKGFGAPSFGTSGAPSGAGFGSFASAGGFAGLASQKPAESPFSKPAGESLFAKPAGASVFGNQSTSTTSFGTTSQKSEESKGLFGLGGTGFKLESSFKGDGSAVNDGPKPEKPTGSLFSLGESLDEMVSTPNKASPPTESMDDMEDESSAPPQEKPEAKPGPSLFGAPSKFGATAPSNIFGTQTQAQTPKPFGAPPTDKSPFAMFGNKAAEKPPSAPFSPTSEATAVPSPTFKKEPSTDAESTPIKTEVEAPLPPDSTSRAVYGPGDTSASSNVSKSSVEEAPLPPDFTQKPKETRGAEPEEAPLPPDFTQKPKESKKVEPEEAPLPPDFTKSKPAADDSGEPGPVPDGSDADESGFTDSGEDITHEVSEEEGEEESEEEEEDEEEEGEPEAREETPKITPESSFGASFGAEKSDKSSLGGLFSRVSQPVKHEQQPPRQLFGEVAKPFFPPGPNANREPPRSPSPVRRGVSGTLFKHKKQPPGSALAARKASLGESARREGLLTQPSAPAFSPEQAHIRAQAQREEEESLSLSDDEDERLHADLARPVEPVPTLDPFLPHQDYTGETSKPGIPGQIEKLYRDINSMVDTLGINSRSLSSFLLFQQQEEDSDWVQTLEGDQPADIQDRNLRLSQIEKLDDAVTLLVSLLENQRLQGVDEKLKGCQDLLSKDILTLRGQCASIRRTLDAYTDAAAIVSAPLSAEQANLQQDLRSASTDIQAKLADLESAVSLLRARIADAPRSDSSRQSAKRPTVEAVTSTIATMMNMAESKSSDIDVLEAQLRKMGIDTTGSPASREGSPFTTPRKPAGRLPATPGSRGSIDGGVSAYHTPESATRGVNFRSSVNGSARASRLRNIETTTGLATKESAQWKAKMQRRQQIVGGLKQAIEQKKSKVRGVDDV
jgi:nucleoporin NUP159